MRPKASSMITFGWIMLVVYALLSGTFYLMGDREHGTMFLTGIGAWCIMLLVWVKTKTYEEE